MGNEKILVTGGAGYLGSVLVPMLYTYGYDPVILDCGWNGYDHVLVRQWYHLQRSDIFSLRELDNFDAIIHLASVSRASLEREIDSSNIENHYKETEHLLSLCKHQKFLFASSASVYGHQGSVCLQESDDCHPVCCYGSQKLACEQLVHDYGGVCLRMGTLMGPSPLMRNDLAVNAMTRSAVKERIVRIWGPENYRPHLHVGDAARAYLFFLKNYKSGIYNIAFDNLSMKSLANCVASNAAAYLQCPIEIQSVDQEEPRSYCVDTSQLRSLGFWPYLSVDQAMRELCAYYS